jgi:hypothetical protein
VRAVLERESIILMTYESRLALGRALEFMGHRGILPQWAQLAWRRSPSTSWARRSGTGPGDPPAIETENPQGWRRGEIVPPALWGGHTTGSRRKPISSPIAAGASQQRAARAELSAFEPYALARALRCRTPNRGSLLLSAPMLARSASVIGRSQSAKAEQLHDPSGSARSSQARSSLRSITNASAQEQEFLKRAAPSVVWRSRRQQSWRAIHVAVRSPRRITRCSECWNIGSVVGISWGRAFRGGRARRANRA